MKEQKKNQQLRKTDVDKSDIPYLPNVTDADKSKQEKNGLESVDSKTVLVPDIQISNSATKKDKKSDEVSDVDKLKSDIPIKEKIKKEKDIWKEAYPNESDVLEKILTEDFFELNLLGDENE